MKTAGVFWKVIPRNTRAWLTRRLHPTFTVSAAGLITNDEGQVLLLHHVFRPVSGWGVPGGFLEKREQAEDGLRREVREETGLELFDVRFYAARTRGRHIEIVMLARGKGQAEVRSREITELGWFDLNALPGQMTADERALIQTALGHRKDG